VALVVLVASISSTSAADAQLQTWMDGTNLLLQVRGDADDEWRIQTSSDLVTWETISALGTLPSGKAEAPLLSVGEMAGPNVFYRALRTAGLYDPTIVRTISLTFTEANWQTILANNYGRDTNLAGTLTFNGRTYPGVGVRYRGNTSYQMGGQKKSVNITVDYTTAGADVMGYDTLNLNNAAGDETIMRDLPAQAKVAERFIQEGGDLPFLVVQR
jgi:hypothetical protein